MANCANCSAPLPPGSIRCAYCGSRNDVDLKGVNYYTTHGTDSGRTCPRCAITLKTIDLKVGGTFLIERCDDCFGLFFDPGELDALLAASVANVFEIDRKGIEAVNAGMRSSEYGISYIKCPVCANLMNRVNFGAKSGVIVNRCRDHGIWLDGGELRHLFEWMKAGGKLLDREVQEERKREEAREVQERLARSADPDCSGFGSYGITLRHDDPDLFDMVAKAIRFFVK